MERSDGLAISWERGFDHCFSKPVFRWFIVEAQGRASPLGQTFAPIRGNGNFAEVLGNVWRITSFRGDHGKWPPHNGFHDDSKKLRVTPIMPQRKSNIRRGCLSEVETAITLR